MKEKYFLSQRWTHYDIPTLNLKDEKATLGGTKIFTDIRSLAAERNSQMPPQRIKTLKRLK